MPADRADPPRGTVAATVAARRLVARPLSASAFAPFGEALQADAPGAASGIDINAGSARRHELPPPDLADAGGAACLAIFRTAGPVHAPPWTLTVLERHRLGSQTFVPLGGARCLAVVAPALPSGGPDAAGLQVFLVAPGQGVTLHRGTWHHPLLTPGPAAVLVLERRGAEPDCEVVPLDGRWEVVLPPDGPEARTG
jgi:ureidoglycolate lyase